MHPIVFLPVFIAVLIALNACATLKGSIVILENPDGTGVAVDFAKWSDKNKCTLTLDAGDTLQVEVACPSGEIDLVISGRNGSEPYEGKSLRSAVFTVTVSEKDQYDVRITGKNATGKVTVKKA